MKSLLKTEMKNLPLSIPAPWLDFFDAHAATLGVSRNAVFRLAMKFGGPILQRLCEVARERLRDSIENTGWTSEIVVSPALPPARATTLADERRQSEPSSGRRRPEKPGGREEIARQTFYKTAGNSGTGTKGNGGRVGQRSSRPARKGNTGGRAQ